MKKILIIIDMQNDFIEGSLSSKQAQKIAPNVCKKIENFEGEIYATMDTHDQDYLDTLEGQKLPVKHCIKDTIGHELNSNIKNSLFNQNHFWGNKIISKNTFGYTKWNEIFKIMEEEIESIELCGLCTSICVLANAVILRAFYPNIKIIVDATCCACISEESHNMGLEAMRMQQIDVIF